MTKSAPVLAALAVAVVVALVTLAVAGLLGAEPDGLDVAAGADEGSESSPEKQVKKSRGHGPPPWAHGPKGDHKAWQRAWKKMTPQQREQTMTRLAQEHAAGMRAWVTCKADGRDDCEKPVPPGLAKKQLRG
jgi:hypothetical protein